MDRQPAVSGPDLLKQVNILNAIYWLNNSWQEVEETTIQKCFKKAGFNLSVPEETSDTQVVPNEVTSIDADDDIPLAVLKLSYDLFGCSFCDLVTIDDHIQTCDTNTTDWNKPALELLGEFNKDCCENESDEDADDNDHLNSTSVPTLADATNMVTQLKTFALHSGQSTMLDLVCKLDEELSSVVSKSKKQTKITDFFERPQ